MIPAILQLMGGTSSIDAGTTAVYASDACGLQDAANSDGVAINLHNFYGTISGGAYAVYAYTQETDIPIRGIVFTASSSANKVTPSGAPVGTVQDTDKTVATILAGTGSAQAAPILRAARVTNTTPVVLPEEPEEISFTDVSEDDWYYEAVQYAAQNELLIGVTETEFAPDRAMNRAMMTALLHRMADEPEVTGTVPFLDTDSSAYYAKALVWAYQNGIASGVSDGVFAPGGTVTRQQLITFLYRYSNASGGSTELLSSFADASDIADYAKQPMAWALENGIIQGDGLNRLKPNAPATRAQCAAIIQRYEESRS
jgi:hypothetical protein